MQLHWGVQIPLRDGVQLSATLYLPCNLTEPAPALFTLTPYVGQTYHDRGLYFAAHGYPFLTVDVRGRGNSDGLFEPLVNEAKDAFDVIEWLAKRPYCNGKVAMWGGSYSGYVQWAAAKEFPPHLTTIVPAASPYPGIDFPARANIPKPYLMQWLTLVWGRTSQDRLFWGQERYWGDRFRHWFESGESFRALDKHLGCPSPIFQRWLDYPEQGKHWDRLNPTPAQYGNIKLPVLTITGCYDGDQPGALAHYRAHLQHNSECTHYLVIGPWDHAGTRTPMQKFCGIECGPESLVDLAKLHREWYGWIMRGRAKPEFLKQPVAYYVMGAEKWRYVDSIDGITARSATLYLHSTSNSVDVHGTGLMTETAPANDEPDFYVYDPHDTALASLECTVDPENHTDQRMVLASSGKQIVYHTEPFDRATELNGFFKLTAWIAIDQRDTDFRASVYEIGLDGSSILLSFDSMRARYRKSLRQAELINSSEPLRYDFEHFTFIAREIRRGHRLRLVVGPINSIYSQKNYNSGGVVTDETVRDSRSVRVRLFHDRDHPSVLHVPIGRA